MVFRIFMLNAWKAAPSECLSRMFQRSPTSSTAEMYYLLDRGCQSAKTIYAQVCALNLGGGTNMETYIMWIFNEKSLPSLEQVVMDDKSYRLILRSSYESRDDCGRWQLRQVSVCERWASVNSLFSVVSDTEYHKEHISAGWLVSTSCSSVHRNNIINDI